jgi:uncharacterized membrane protein YphA (DoxX/SURF4 family)
MNTLIWIGQLALAAVFLTAGFSKLFAYRKLIKTLESRRKTAPITLLAAQGRIIGIVEILGAIGVITPASLAPIALASDHKLVLLSASALALLMVAATIYHFRRRESAAPAVAAFLLALFVIVGRWPH